ncbi:MAG: NAD(P)/FAD-dependent oxidoreductase [archaeon]
MDHDYDVLIIGAGPIGSSLACKLKSSGLKVAITDKKKIIGKHACSGLFSKRITEYFDLDSDLIENTIEGATFHTRNIAFEVNKKKTEALVIDRVRFDRFIFKKVLDCEVDTIMDSGFRSCRSTKDGFESILDTESSIKKVTSRLLIGADGAASTVRRSLGLKGDLNFVNGILSYYPIKDSSPLVELYYSPHIAPGFFAWKIPRGTRTEYGLATDTNHNHIEYFKKFLAGFNLPLKQFHTHPICYGNQKTVADNALLIGDAAAQVKPFSGGGVIYGLICADIAAKAISHAFDKQDLTKQFLKTRYEDIWKKKLMPKIEIGLGIRNILNSLSDRELDTFFSMLKDQKSKIESLGDMDFL